MTIFNFAACSLFILITLLSSAQFNAAHSLPVKTTKRMVKSYETSEAALQDLKIAMQSENPEELVKLFGEQARPFLVTGDLMADQAMMRRMDRKLNERAELVSLVNHEYPTEQWYKVRFGAPGWDMYIPIVNRGDGWLFATEIALYAEKRTRKVINEDSAIKTLRMIMGAQHQYFSQDLDEDRHRDYARQIISTPGKRNGLFWEPEDTGLESPLHWFALGAAEDGYTSIGKDSLHHEGYVFRVLTGESENGKKKALSYIQNGRLTEGIALIAYPVKWNSSGSNTFVMESNGQIWKKDLGSRTANKVEKMQTLHHDHTWYRAG